MFEAAPAVRKKRAVTTTTTATTIPIIYDSYYITGIMLHA